jgi:hypothetical protein
MNVPNIQEIAHDRISPSIANSDGALHNLLWLPGQEAKRGRELASLREFMTKPVLNFCLLFS